MRTKEVWLGTRLRKTGPYAGLLVGLLVVSWALWKLPKWQIAYLKNLTPEQRLDKENEARKTLAQMLGGLFVLVGAYLTWRSLQLTERTSQETLRISQEGQITDRFTKAIAQLGDKQLEVRLGGIYALERIARDSPRDHWTIVEVLTAFVREKSPRKEAQFPRPDQPVPDPKTDIQAILTVLGRRERGQETPEQRINLDRTDLRGIFLQGADLSGARLFDADLRHSFIAESNLSHTLLDGADLSHARFVGTSLAGATFHNANLLFASLYRAILDEAGLWEADLSRTVGLTQEQIQSSRMSEMTKLPPGLRVPEAPRQKPG